MSNIDMRRNAWDKGRNTLREALKEARAEAGLTQVELAKKLKTSQVFISKYERGDRNLDFIEVVLICNACNYSVDKLLAKLRLK